MNRFKQDYRPDGSRPHRALLKAFLIRALQDYLNPPKIVLREGFVVDIGFWEADFVELGVETVFKVDADQFRRRLRAVVRRSLARNLDSGR